MLEVRGSLARRCRRRLERFNLGVERVRDGSGEPRRRIYGCGGDAVGAFAAVHREGDALLELLEVREGLLGEFPVRTGDACPARG